MAVCAAFVRSTYSASAWARCARRAVRGRLCVEHRDGLDGALLGLVKFQELLPLELEQRASRPARKRHKRRKKKSSPAWDTRNAAAATTTPERLEPDPARACPAPISNEQSVLQAAQS